MTGDYFSVLVSLLPLMIWFDASSPQVEKKGKGKKDKNDAKAQAKAEAAAEAV